MFFGSVEGLQTGGVQLHPSWEGLVSGRSTGRLVRFSKKMLGSSDEFRGDTGIQICNRSIKPHEVKPFSQVDGVSNGKRISLQNEGLSKSREKVHSTVRTGCTQPMPACRGSRTSAFCSPYSSPTPSGRSQRSPRMYLSPTVRVVSPNVHVKMPFKHSVQRTKDMEARVKEPSQKFKELTAAATWHVKQILDAYCGERIPQPTGRLQRGRLKPLNPVVMTTPKIECCRGIVSETRSYCPNASRTLQRRRQIMRQVRAGETAAYDNLLYGDRRSDSVHRVSAASSLDDVWPDEHKTERADEDNDAEADISENETNEFTMNQL